MDGGLGDHIGALVAVDYAIKTYPWINFLVWTPNYLLDPASASLPKGSTVRNYTAMERQYDRNKITKTTKWDGHHSPMKTHGVDYAFLKLCDENPSIDNKNYLKPRLDYVATKHYSLPNKYVVITTGYTAKVREFDPNTVNTLIDYIIGKGYMPVFLGQKTTKTGAAHVIEGRFADNIRYDKGINLINKTDLLQATKVMQNAKAVVGVDCGLLHLAGMTDVPIVAGFTTVNPSLRAPIRHNELGWQFHTVVPDESLDCKFCQVSTNFLYGHDYRNCLYDDYKCVSQLTPEKFIKHLEGIL